MICDLPIVLLDKQLTYQGHSSEIKCNIMLTGSVAARREAKEPPYVGEADITHLLSLYAGLGTRSFAHSLFALFLKIAHFKEQP